MFTLLLVVRVCCLNGLVSYFAKNANIIPRNEIDSRDRIASLEHIYICTALIYSSSRHIHLSGVSALSGGGERRNGRTVLEEGRVGDETR